MRLPTTPAKSTETSSGRSAASRMRPCATSIPCRPKWRPGASCPDARLDPMPDFLELDEADDGKLFLIRIDNTGEERIARYHWLWLAGRELKFPCFADPDHPEDYLRWVHDGNARAVSRVSSGEGALQK